jgi:hypothetical protein
MPWPAIRGSLQESARQEVSQLHALVAEGFFGQGFFHAFIYMAVAFTWAFALVELLRSGSRGWVKAVWTLVIIGIPIAGAVAYLLVSPSNALQFDPREGKPMSAEQRDDLDYAMSNRPIG